MAELLVQILSAVDYLHGRWVVHLDLKSDNMLVNEQNQLKIVDLGSAQPFTPGQPVHIEHFQGLAENKGNYSRMYIFINIILYNIIYTSSIEWTFMHEA